MPVERKEKMDIDFNKKECSAMEAYSRGEPEEGARLQQAFLESLQQGWKAGKDHCSCPADCELHGNCVLCVQVHRGHGDHLPHCFHPALNKKLMALSQLSEHSIVEEIKKPDYL